jgi:hypothetical protein
LLDRNGAEEAERVRDRDAAKAERTQAPVRPGRQRSPTASTVGVERVTRHHARDAASDRGAERLELACANARAHVSSLVGRHRRGSEPREVLDARGDTARREATRECNTDRGISEVT